MAEWATGLSAATSLIAVVVTGAVAILSVRRQGQEARAQRDHQHLLALLPKRVDAYQLAWRVLYEVQAGETLDQSRINKIVEVSMWLDADVRSQILSIASTGSVDQVEVKAIRDKIRTGSGADRF